VTSRKHRACPPAEERVAPKNTVLQAMGRALGVMALLVAPLSLAGQDVSPPPQAAQQALATGGDISGVVKAGNLALPGVTVTAAHTLTGQKVATWTDVSGGYSLHVAANGRWVVRAEMAAFAPATREVVINAASSSARVDLEMTLASRAQEATQEQQGQATPPERGGFQRLNAVATELSGLTGEGESTSRGDEVLPGAQAPGFGATTATETVSVTGNAQSTNLGDFDSRQRQEMREQQGPGGPGGPGGEGGGGPRGPFAILGGRRGNFRFDKLHGSLFYSAGDSALDAAPYSLTGALADKPGYIQQRFGGVLGGPLNIPKIYHGGQKTFFFASYSGTRGENPFDAFSTVPTLAERGGDFSNAQLPGSGAGSPVVIVDLQTGQPFPQDKIPAGRINFAATALLPFIPLPNVSGVQNFHFVTSTSTRADNISARVVHTFGGQALGRGPGGQRHNLNVGFRFQDSDNQVAYPFPSVGGSTSVRGIDVPIGYVRSFGKLTNSFRFDFNRNRISTRNLYAFVRNVEANAEINGVSQNPFDWGLPGLSFTHFGGISDIVPLLNRNQTFSFSDSMIWTRGKHTLRWGGDFRRIQINTETDKDARGTFTFTGAFSGFDFADFLLGLPQLTSVQFGSTSYHFRGNSWDLFAQDEWRVRGNLTLNLGLRYEYVSPLRETNNQIVNLDIAQGFTAAAPVLPGATGPFNGVLPLTLVKPDRNNFAPRIGIAWKPGANTVVRAGYGINYNTGAYSGIAQQLAFQPPFSFTETNVASPALPLTLQNGFPPSLPSTVTNNYAVNPDYRLGYVQIWNLGVQKQISTTLVLNLDYTGTKGTRLDIVEAPNRGPSGVRIPGVQPFLWQSSDANSVAQAGTVRLRKRLQGGFSFGGSYTYSKSIDDASTIGGGATVVAQNAFDLAAERGLSSFDQRHRFTADYLWELRFGRDRRWLRGKGLGHALLGDWQWSGDWTIASGLPFTARVLGDFSDVSRGTNGTLRADASGQPVSLANPTTAEWFNTAAFVVPPAGSFGNVGRNTIVGPPTHVFDMAFQKTVTFGEVRSLEFRLQASNIFNTPQFTTINTIVNSPSFGQVISVGSMRRLQLSTRFRF
jgi:trimeric autotransporter adhesin